MQIRRGQFNRGAAALASWRAAPVSFAAAVAGYARHRFGWSLFPVQRLLVVPGQAIQE